MSGPCIGGIITTFAQWRIIYWLQFGMTALGLILSLFFLPTINNKREVEAATRPRTVRSVLSMFNPLRIFGPFIYPNIFLCVSSIYQSASRNELIKLTNIALDMRSPRNIPIRYPHIRQRNL